MASGVFVIVDNYSLFSTFLCKSGGNPPFLAITATRQRREVHLWSVCTDARTKKMYGARLLTLRGMRVTRKTGRINNMASGPEGVTTETTESVAEALRELALSRGDQDKLSEFLTDYFASPDPEDSSGK